jgi:DNA-binding IclR family transcriptional regulator
MPSPSERRSRVPAAEQTLRILTYLAGRAGPQPAGRIADDLQLPRSTTYHLLNVLQEHGFVVHLPEERRYGLGVSAFEIGSAYTHQEPLTRLARPLLARLVDSVGHNAHLAASGRAMLAALPPAQVRALFPDRSAFVQRHGTGPETLPALRRVLTDVRARGFAEEDGEITPGFASVAAAVLDHSGYPAAGLAVTFPVEDVGFDQRGELADRVTAAAHLLTRRIGGRPL